MPETRDLLQRAGRSAPRATFELIDLERRRDRRNARRKAATIVVALALAAGTFGTAFVALRHEGGTAVGSTGATGTTGTGPETALPPATVAPLVADPGEYYVHRVHMVADCTGTDEQCGGGFHNELAATFWWRADESGRIQVDVAEMYGITEGTFEPGTFPNDNGIDVSGFPTDPGELADFLLARSQPGGASPAPLVSPPPGGAPEDGQMWRAITDLLENAQVPPAVRAALLDVAADLAGSQIRLDGTDPAGRHAHVIEFANDGGALIERLFVDPSTHEFLGRTLTWPGENRPFQTWLVEMAGLASSTQDGPTVTSISTVG